MRVKAINISLGKRKPGLWYLQVTANLARQEIVNLTASGDSGGRTCFPVHEDAVIAALLQELATVSIDVTDKVVPPHSSEITIGSRITGEPAKDFLAKVRFASITNRTASYRFPRASFEVRP